MSFRLCANLLSTERTVVSVCYILNIEFLPTEEDDDTEVNRLMTSRQTVIEVKVPLSVAGAIIGPQGSRIKQVSQHIYV